MTANVTYDKESLEGLIGAVEENPENGKTVWQASTSWLGGFRSQAQIRDFTVTMDEPTALRHCAQYGRGSVGRIRLLSDHRLCNECRVDGHRSAGRPRRT